jgi:serine/threonine protein kinase/tetratricopeptide (TPR) repeat protein
MAATELTELLDRLRSEQHDIWLRGQRPLVEEYVRQYPAIADDRESLLELVYAEFLLRRRLGEDVATGEYGQRFPELAGELRLQFKFEGALEDILPADLTLTESVLLSHLGDHQPEQALQLNRSFAFDERFLFQRTLGSGATGLVFAAYDRQWKRTVAIKTLRRVRPTAILRLKEEFRALADLSHPNLIEYYELFRDGENWFLTMELVRGVDFLQYVRGSDDNAQGEPVGRIANPSEQRQPDGWAIRPTARRLRVALEQLISGLETLHGSGRVHRDIKPANVLVAADDQLVILDLGLVTDLRFDSAEFAGSYLAGTIAYMAPEQLAGHQFCSDGSQSRVHPALMSPGGVPAGALTPACDWYSVGVMLYEALTGRLPFMGDASTVAYLKQTCEPPPPSALAGHVPADLDELCRTLLCRDPVERMAFRELLQPERSIRCAAEPVRLATPTACAPSEHAVGVAAKQGVGTSDKPDRTRYSGQKESVRPAGDAFVGRRRELELLEGELAAARRGETRLVFVAGEPGIGKTCLVERFLQALRDVIILRGRCYQGESLPYKAWDQVMDQAADYLRRQPWPGRRFADVMADLAKTFPTLRRVPWIEQAAQGRPEILDAVEQKRRAVAAFHDLLRHLSQPRVLVVFIDDLHWGDVESAELLLELWDGRSGLPLLLIGGCRREEAAQSVFVQRLRTGDLDRNIAENASGSPHKPDARARQFSDALAFAPGLCDVTIKARPTPAASATPQPVEIQLGPLSGEESSELARRLLKRDGLDDRWAEASRITDGAAGQPLFLRQLAQVVQEGGLMAATGMPLRELLWGRVCRLDDASRQLVTCLAVAGRPSRATDIYQAAGLSEPEPSQLNQLRKNLLIRSQPAKDCERIEIYHDRVRESVLEHLSPVELADQHRRLAETLEDSGKAEPEMLFVHFREAGQTAKAGRCAAQAAQRAAETLAFDRACDLYRQALELGRWTPDDDPQQRTLRTHLADALANAGRGAEAADVYLQVAEAVPPAESLRLERRAALQYCISGHTDDGRTLLGKLLRSHHIEMHSNPLAIWLRCCGSDCICGCAGSAMSCGRSRTLTRNC